MRSGVLVLRNRLFGLAVGALTALLAASIQPLVSSHEAHADARESVPADEIAVGTELMATEDLQLSRAGIAKGSRVSVTKLLLRQGDLTNVDVVLADGHVVKKIAIGTIRCFFRVVNAP